MTRKNRPTFTALDQTSSLFGGTDVCLNITIHPLYDVMPLRKISQGISPETAFFCPIISQFTEYYIRFGGFTTGIESPNRQKSYVSSRFQHIKEGCCHCFCCPYNQDY
jgi:hypothetical protein